MRLHNAVDRVKQTCPCCAGESSQKDVLGRSDSESVGLDPEDVVSGDVVRVV